MKEKRVGEFGADQNPKNLSRKVEVELGESYIDRLGSKKQKNGMHAGKGGAI